MEMMDIDLRKPVRFGIYSPTFTDIEFEEGGAVHQIAAAVTDGWQAACRPLRALKFAGGVCMAQIPPMRYDLVSKRIAHQR